MFAARLVRAFTVVALSLTTALASAPGSTGTDSAAGVIVGVTGHVTIERPAANARTAALGMRLDPIDVIVVDRGASAEIYLKGGGVVHLRDATRFEMPKAADAPARGATQAKLSSGSIAQLESGLWVLNDPQGSLLVSPMRGDGAWEPTDSAVPLSPRYETLTAPSAQFVWNGGPAKARVVVAKRREVVWTSAPTASGTVLDAGASLPLSAGDVYTWWLEPEAGGPPLTAGVPFRIAAKDILERTKTVENELRSMSGAEQDPSTVDYLRIAFYAGASSWTRVLELATQMPKSDARSRALAAAAAGLRLDSRAAETLATRLGADRKR
jgi:hypothetical protein